MCLATAYKKKLDPENVCAENIMKIVCQDGIVTMIDIFGRRTDVKGTLEMTNFDSGKALIRVDE